MSTANDHHHQPLSRGPSSSSMATSKETVTLVRFQSANKKDATVEVTLDDWGDDVWQLVYR